MADKTFLIKFKAAELAVGPVVAATVEIHGDHLILTDSAGGLAALFLMDLVESWTVLPLLSRLSSAT